MTGTDWRNYEPIYTTGDGLSRFVTEPISYALFSYMPKVIPDYVLFMAILKCLYLYSFIKLVSSITEKWRACTGLLVMGQLSFLLIDGPIRYTLGLLFVNFALLVSYKYLIGHKIRLYYLKLFTLLIAAVFCHNTCAIFLILVPLLPLSKNLSKVNIYVLFCFYLTITVLTSNVEFLSSFIGNFQEFMAASNLNEYSSYEVSDNSNVFSIGNVVRIFFFLFVLLTRDVVIKNHKNGNILFNLTVIYCFFVRFFIIIPTGHRLPMPFSTFYIIYIVYMLMSERYYNRIILAYMVVSFTFNTWTSFNLIPYTNSIPYFIIGHKQMQERYYYNFNEYRERMGQNHTSYYLYQGV
jgi:hypothetical protein